MIKRPRVVWSGRPWFHSNGGRSARNNAKTTQIHSSKGQKSIAAFVRFMSNLFIVVYSTQEQLCSHAAEESAALFWGFDESGVETG
jgi:hypothetical protein